MLYTGHNMNIYSATDARNHFFEILNSVIFKGEEVIVEKEDAGRVRIISEKTKRPSREKIDQVLSDLRKVFAKSKKRKYWSVLDTPAWKKKERKYLEDLSRGIIR